MALAPRARLATHGLGALRLSTMWPLPLDRVHALALGDRLDVGDRTLVAVRPPTFDNPMSTGIFDERTSTLFSVDAFGAILPSAAADIDDIAADELVGGMVAWTTFGFSMWINNTATAAMMCPVAIGLCDGIRKLCPADPAAQQQLSAAEENYETAARLAQSYEVVASTMKAQAFIVTGAHVQGAGVGSTRGRLGAAVAIGLLAGVIGALLLDFALRRRAAGAETIDRAPAALRRDIESRTGSPR
jgi:hypothetical protein